MLRLHGGVLTTAAVLVLALVCLAVLLPDILTRSGPFIMNAHDALKGPSAAHWFGTDDFGRDLYTRVVYGARTSLGIAVISIALATLVGSAAGLVAGFYRDSRDRVLARVMDVLFSFPSLLLAIVIAGILGPSVKNAVAAIAIVYTPYFFRVARAGALSQAALDYVVGARALGASGPRIILRHVLPNISAQISVQAAVYLAYAMLVEASLSYLGLGVQPPNPSWGSILNEGRQYLQTAPWISIFPGVAIMLTVMAFNLLGDVLRDRWDPRQVQAGP